MALSQSVSWREKSKSGEVNKPVRETASQQKGKKKKPTHLVDEVSGKKGVYTAGMYHIRGLSKPKAFAVNVELCGEPHKLETDTSATRNVLKEEAYNKLREKVKLKSSKTILSTYTR